MTERAIRIDKIALIISFPFLKVCFNLYIYDMLFLTKSQVLYSQEFKKQNLFVLPTSIHSSVQGLLCSDVPGSQQSQPSKQTSASVTEHSRSWSKSSCVPTESQAINSRNIVIHLMNWIITELDSYLKDYFP